MLSSITARNVAINPSILLAPFRVRGHFVPLSMGRQKMSDYTNSLMYFLLLYCTRHYFIGLLIHPGSIPGIPATLAVAAIILAVPVPISVPVITVVPVVTGTVVPAITAGMATIELVASVLSHLLAHLTLHQGPADLHPLHTPTSPNADQNDEQNGNFHFHSFRDTLSLLWVGKRKNEQFKDLLRSSFQTAISSCSSFLENLALIPWTELQMFPSLFPVNLAISAWE